MATRGRPKALLVLSNEERVTLERLARRPETAQALALSYRVGVCRGCHQQRGGRAGRSASGHGWKWRSRFVARRLDGLSDELRPGAPRTITDDDVEQVIVKKLEVTPPVATH